MNTTLRAKAIDYLSRRDHSRFELKNKLLAKQFDPDEVTTLLDELAAEGLQSDARVAENYVRRRREAGFGPERVSYELEAKGISKKIISEKVDPHAIEWRRHMIFLLARRYPEKTTASATEKARFLMNRGFLLEEIFHYLKIERLEEHE